MKRGDSLIEVMIAIGVFSMVAISVISVMNGGTASVQTALETTMVRNEIDVQADAIRFIHASAIAELGSSTSTGQKYFKAWRELTKLADKNSIDQNQLKKVTEYDLASCAELYDSTNQTLNQQNAFFINTRKLATNQPEQAIIKASSTTLDSFRDAKLYSRILFDKDDGALLNPISAPNPVAEGFYVVGVKDPDSSLVAGGGTHLQKKSVYYDFYIRSCWYGPGENVPSTISTVIRLHNPNP